MAHLLGLEAVGHDPVDNFADGLEKGVGSSGKRGRISRKEESDHQESGVGSAGKRSRMSMKEGSNEHERGVG